MKKNQKLYWMILKNYHKYNTFFVYLKNIVYYKIYIMEEKFLISIFITVTYFTIRFIDLKWISKKNNNKEIIKKILKESIIVYISCIIGLYGYEYFNINSKIIKGSTNAYIDNPNF